MSGQPPNVIPFPYTPAPGRLAAIWTLAAECEAQREAEREAERERVQDAYRTPRLRVVR